LAQAALTCHSFYDAQHDNFWYNYCNIYCRTHQCPDFTVEFDSAEALYKELIYPFRELRGNFARLSEPYGGLLQVVWTQDRIIGYDVQAPEYPLLDGVVRKTELFRVFLGEDNKVVTLCSLPCSSGAVHNANVEHSSGCHSAADNVVKITCTAPKEHDVSDRNAFIKTSSFDQHVGFERFQTLQISDLSFAYKEIEDRCKTGLDSKMSDVVEPGFFIGDYGGHGLEIVNLTYKDRSEGSECFPLHASLTKITGDPNICAGSISLQVDLCKPVSFHAWFDYIHDQGSNLPYNLDLDPHGFVTDYHSINWKDTDPATHPVFQSWARSAVNIRYCPKTFQYAFKAKLQLRAIGEAAYYEDAFWIVFNNDVHAVYWIKYHHIFFFHRMTTPA